MKCPRCQSPLPAPVRLNAEGFLVCPACGSKLRPRTPAAAVPGPAPEPAALAPQVEEPPEPDNLLAALAGLSSAEEAPEDTRAGSAPEPDLPAPPPPSTALASPSPASGPGLEAILAELKAIRRSQDRMLDLLTSAPHPAGAFGGPARPAPASAAVRTQRRKTVLIIDDDLASRAELVAALDEAAVPVREAGSGNEGLTLISQERPDVIVIEADLGGDMSSQDTITLIKATMEWIDIPILLYTRHRIADDDEARTSYAADGFVIKSPGAAATLVNRIVAHFRR